MIMQGSWLKCLEDKTGHSDDHARKQRPYVKVSYRIMNVLSSALFIFGLICSFKAAIGNNNCEVKIEISPDQSVVSLMDQSVTISCHVNSRVKDILLLSITKDGDKPMAAMRPGSNQVAYGTTNVLRYQSEGRIDNESKKKYLNLTFLHPRADDTGLYTCAVMYIDQSFDSEVKQGEASSNMTVHSEMDNERHEIVLTHLLAKVTQLETVNSQLVEKVDKLSRTEPALLDRMEAVEGGYANNSIQLDGLIEKASYVSAFSATVSKDTNLHNGQVIIFPIVIASIGDVGYNQTTGVYTAPWRGVYAFHLAFMVGYADRGAYMSIMKNDVQLASVHAHDMAYFDHSSCSTVALLEPGDRVTVVVIHAYPTVPIVRNYWRLSVFSGFLVNPL